MSRYTLAILVATAAPAAVLTAQTLTPYDVFVFQNYSMTNTEVNGRIAIGGNATLDHWRVGEATPSSFTDYSLVVGGDLIAQQGSVAVGQTYIGGMFGGDPSTVGFGPDGPPVVPPTPSPVDFASEITRLTNLSNTYAGFTTTGAVELHGGELNFVGTSPTLNVFSATIAELQEGTTGYEFVTPAGSTDIINVTGTSSSSVFNNTAFFFDCTQVATSSSCRTGSNEGTPEDAGRTLFNFNDQTSLDFGGPVHGSILAPNADATFGVGDVVGNVVVKSATDAAELYSHAEFGNPTPITATPEPATLALFATGLIGVVGFARRRNRKA